ncbi:hypothetical protein [uncultured Ruegeria sp.]|uniref:hypothetical protein n=1 Tax=uncultured Ruegeria sp. TaxID=259304 RepID=UPI0026371D04|nr:hypothetical protein [uncultured Ruegeria sp.]
MSKVPAKVLSAIADARSNCIWGLFEDVPKVDDDKFIRLFEMCHAIEALTENLDAKSSDWVAKSPLMLLNALRDGEIVARAYESNSVIPSAAWPGEIETDPEAFDNCFWYGVIERNDDCFGFVGKLPVVKSRDAEQWLASLLPKGISGAPNKSKAATLEYWSLYEDGHEAEGLQWIQALDAVNEILSQKGLPNVSLRTLQTAIM